MHQFPKTTVKIKPLFVHFNEKGFKEDKTFKFSRSNKKRENSFTSKHELLQVIGVNIKFS